MFWTVKATKKPTSEVINFLSLETNNATKKNHNLNKCFWSSLVILIFPQILFAFLQHGNVIFISSIFLTVSFVYVKES